MDADVNHGKMTIDVRETSARRYLGLEWMNGLLPMRCDINTKHDIGAARRMAYELNCELLITDKAFEWMDSWVV